MTATSVSAGARGWTADLRGQRALVTGSTRGIGAAIAEGLARSGAAVVLHGRDAAGVAAAAEALRARLEGEDLVADVRGAAFDIADPEATLAGALCVLTELGGIDVLVNNAGVQWRSPLLELRDTDWDRVLATNLTSCFLLAREAARGMVDRGRGKIINICSVQSSLVRPTTAPYAAAKAGLASLTRTMCAEWAACGVQVNALAPGYVGTDLNADLVADESFHTWVIGRTPARRWCTPEDVVGPALWLASGASDFVNGQVIYVDGGITAVV
ncbi:MAG TPA: SDR family oxidoreductase [Acidimicrobiales bacterium]|nr:SDR family oxidoreductase [Acidimicrobiales bacterium]